MATSHPNAEIIAINNIPLSTSSSSYGDPCLDLLFNSLVLYERDPNPCLIYLKQLLPLAWSQNPLTTLKLIFSVESICFSYQKFDTAVLWLLQNHPKTLLHNLHSIADLPDCGSLYALVQILYVLLVQDDKDVHLHPERYNRDPYYKLLHDGVIDILVERLNSDIDKMKQHKLELEPSDYSPYYLTSLIDKYHRPRKISAAECCVSKTSWHDHRARTIFLRESIAGRLFPPESDQLEEWERLRKDFLVPLTNYYDRKDKVPYEKRYHRQGRDPCEVKKYLEEVKAAAAAGGGIGIIKPDALLPNEIIDFVSDEDVGVGAELQWKAMVDMYRTQQQKQGEGFGKFKNWLVVGSIKFALPVGLKILMSELSEEPWKGKLIGGEDDQPDWSGEDDQSDWIQGHHDLKSKCELMWKSKYCSVFRAIELILELAVNANLKAEHMIKKVLVFSWENPQGSLLFEYEYEAKRRLFEEIRNKYKEKGYGDEVVPHILFWDVYDYRIPDSWICTRHPGFTTLSGFSDSLVKSFLDNGGEIDHHHVMEAVIAHKEYQPLVVVD
ncbi:uncharacterized protein LOC110752073 [Prunus avium]|uniref:Uncharacterized protein LOC110752073 n=1 Tax=Prunus avium TaxID=42229 RepID=A0A6P5RU06_PRUAV|nr:uncharacterized protein LOC110752073 [Prunus avium]